MGAQITSRMRRKRNALITPKQKSARRRNMAIARKARKSGKGKTIKLNPSNKSDRKFMIAAFKAGVVKIR